MAVTYVGAGGIVVGVGAVTPPLPASLTTDDILLCLCRSVDDQPIAIANSNGGTWTEAPSSPQAEATGGVRLTVFWSRYNGTQGDPTTTDSGTVNIARILAFRGVTTSDPPFDVSNGNVQAATTAGSISGATSTIDDVYAVAISGCDRDAASTANASGWTNASLASITELVDEIVASGQGGGFAVAGGIKTTAGTIDATTWTQAAAGALANILLTLKPAASGNNYDETGGVVSAAATLTGTDQVDFEETGGTVSVAASVTATDQADFEETGGVVSIAATVTGTDTLGSGGTNYDETGLLVTVAATLTGTDQKDMHEGTLEVGVAAVLSGLDQADFEDTGSTVNLLAVLSGQDIHDTGSPPPLLDVSWIRTFRVRPGRRDRDDATMPGRRQA